MPDHAVIGLGFGDCGKGRVVDDLCRTLNMPTVIRYSGGQQAGHHVVLDEKTDHVFSNFGSGTFRGAPTYISEFCTIDPVGILTELAILKSKNTTPELYINSKCPVTTLYDKMQDQFRDEHCNHGSCCVGVGETWHREENHFSLLFEDLFYPSALKLKLEMIKTYYENTFMVSKPSFVEATIKQFDKLLDQQNIHIVTSNIFSPGHRVFEGSQGLLLDQHHGFFPHVTRSNTGLKNIIPEGTHKNLDLMVHLVTRAYQTRHGNGPMTNEEYKHNIADNPWEMNNDDGVQGIFRRTILDVDLLKYAIAKDPHFRLCKKRLIITCLDLVKDAWEFTYKGNKITCNTEDDFVDGIATILGIQNVALSWSAYGAFEESGTE